MGHHGKSDPRQSLIGVVGAADEVEQPGKRIQSRVRDHAGLRALWSEVSQGHMDGKVTQLSDKEGGQTAVDLKFAVGRGRVQWMVDIVGDIGCKTIVVATIFEYVPDGHRGVRETMDEQRLKQSFNIVEDPTSCRDIHNKMPGFARGISTVNESRPGIKESINHKRAGVFC